MLVRCPENFNRTNFVKVSARITNIFKYRRIIWYAVLFLPYVSNAQTSPIIRSPRPGQAFGPFTTGAKVFQLQTGFNINSIDGPETEGNGFNYLASFRYSFTETFEVRSAFRLNSDKIITDGEETTLDGLSSWIVGVRFNVLNNAGTSKASLGFQADANINIFNNDFQLDHPAPRMIFLHGQRLSKWLSLVTNWGIAWNGFNGEPRGLYRVKFNIVASSKISVIIENYGNLIDGKFYTFFNTGPAWLITNDLLLDLTLGFGRNRGIENLFVDFGFSWRTKPLGKIKEMPINN